MSEYQRIKARALEIQREKEYELKRELARKAEHEKKAAKEEEERKKRIDAATKEARRIELMRANDALHKTSAKPTGPADGYDPFAEDAFSGPRAPVARSTPKTATRPNAGSHGPRTTNAASTSKPRASGSGSGSKAKAKPELVMGRKEKAALKLQRAAQGKAGAEESLFSVHALVHGSNSNGNSRTGSLGPASGTSSPRRPPPARPTSAPPRSGPLGRAPASAASAKNTSMSQLKKNVDVKQLRKLCADRDTRDKRTLDEVQRDIRIRKGLPVGANGSGSSTPRGGDRDRERERERAKPSSRPTSSGAGASRPGDRDRRDRDRDYDRDRDRGRDRERGRDRDRRRRSPSSEYESDSPPPRKRSRYSPELRGEPSASHISSLIQGMFRRPDRGPVREYDDDSGSDMEAGLSDVEMEEKRALKIARREDEEAEREENARREAKEKMKRARK